MEALNKVALYLQAAVALRSPHWRGLPLVPKSLCDDIPFSRTAYNSFIIWIKRLALPSANVIVDVGANHGDFANAASTCFPGAEVFVVEPLPKMQRCLEQNIRDLRKKWRLLPCALGSERGRFPLFVDENRDDIASLAGFSAEYLKANPAVRPSKEVLCEVLTLDEVAREQNIHHIDLLKIDVEGFELEVIKGGRSILPRTTAIIIEVSLIRKAAAVNPLVEILEILTSAGFQILNVIPSFYDSVETWRPFEFNILARRAPD